jgi:hypothetical protein
MQGFGRRGRSLEAMTARKAVMAVLAGVALAAVFLVSASAGVSLVTTFGGLGSSAGALASPWGVAIGSSGDVYVSDVQNNRISEFSAKGTFVKAWGWGVSDGASHFETCTSTCQTGLSGGGAGELNVPDGIATDTLGNVYVADDFNERVDEFSPSGAFIEAFGKDVDQTTGGDVCTAASGDTCQTGSQGSAAGELSAPLGVAVDGSGTVYVANYLNDRIDVFASSSGAFIEAFGKNVDQTTSSDVCTAASGDTCQSGSEGGAAGEFFQPADVAVSGGNLYIADAGNDRIDELSSSGVFAKAWGWGVSDGASSFETCPSSCQAGIAGGGAGQMDTPAGVGVDGPGDVYVADFMNDRIDEFSSSGTFLKAWGWGVRTGASSFEWCTTSCHAGISGAEPGQFRDPYGVGAPADSSGVVYVADRSNSRIQEFSNTDALTVSRSGLGSGAVKSSLAGIHCGRTCAHAYGDGTVVMLTAEPSFGSVFAGWAGACTGTGDCAVTMNQARRVKATFTLGEIGPVTLSARGLRSLTKKLHQRTYWAGREARHRYELTRTAIGYAYVRYLPAGVKAGSRKRYLTIATYPFPRAFRALKRFARGKHLSIPGGGIALVRRGDPHSILLAWRGVGFQVEVYSPSAAQALGIAKSGRVTPVR